MRNKLLLILLLSGLLMVIFVVTKNAGFFSTEQFPAVTNTPNLGNIFDLKFNQLNLKVSYFKVNELDKISLKANFEEKLSSSRILENENCKYLANGGFYDKSDKPIGLFVSEGQKISNETNSSLFNGYINVGDNFFITQSPLNSRIVLQTGPILIKDNHLRTLNLRNDEFARRIVVSKTQEGVYFFAIYNKDSQISGPKLADLPQITSQIGEVLGLTILDAINLDGGSASSFFDGFVLFKELSPIGSYFCIAS